MSRTPLSEIEKRNEKMLEYMHGRSGITIDELADYLKVSAITVRRDINYLLNERLVLRTGPGRYGLNEDPSFDAALFKRYAAHHLEKTMIAKKAIEQVQSGQVIGLDSSTTVLELGKILGQVENLTVVTNNLFIPAYLCQHPSLRIFFAGGSVYLVQNSTEGADTCNSISNFHYDIAFISANAFDFDCGLSNTDFASIDSKLAYVNNADRCILLLDSSKIGKKAGKQFLPVDRIDLAITDGHVSQEHIRCFREVGLDLIIAE